MEKILNELEKFGFSKIDAQVYVAILKKPRTNGSQVSKEINIPRTSVYSSIRTLYEKGAIHLISGSNNTYIANNPVEFIKKLKVEYNNAANYLEETFATFESCSESNDFINLKGNNNATKKIKEMICSAKQEIYINTNYDLGLFYDELIDAKNRKVRIILFTFKKQEFEKFGISEYYYNPKFSSCVDDSEIKRTILVIDCNVAFIGSGTKDEDFFATYSHNKLFVKIISEHIHHDIYLYKLENSYGTEWYDKMKIETLHELSYKKD